MSKYYTVDELVEMINEPNRSACQKILGNFRNLFQNTVGSVHNHQSWPGGYWDHVQEIMNLAFVNFVTLNNLRPMPFSLSDALLVTFLHDIEKPWKYEQGPDGRLRHREKFQSKQDAHVYREKFMRLSSIVLTPEQANALQYVEGEFDDYSNRKRVMGPLAAFCHVCDVTSARIFFDYPLEKNDPWAGAKRFRD
ncbi:MAG: hypothetical protein Q7S32_01180 [bacterium]|nr:hypothetical protein [bacterium]